jgi:acyl CoA:acetate/3-ketoacid CoA transferase beta subunit
VAGDHFRLVETAPDTPVEQVVKATAARLDMQ